MKENMKENGRFGLTIGWLYPDLMNTYGDRGNITVLGKRLAWRGMGADLKTIGVGDSAAELARCDLLFMGGAQDRQQEIVMKDMAAGKAEILGKMVEKGIPGLFICGAYQFMGKYYKAADGTVIDGLGVFDIHTESPGNSVPRLIGNIVASPKLGNGCFTDKLVGFENHGGRTYLGKNSRPFAAVEKGFGNNGVDGTEGTVYKNAVGTYLHGPILPKNPELADYLLSKAFAVKYGREIPLAGIDRKLEDSAREAIMRRI